MTVAELRQRVSSREFGQWMQLAEVRNAEHEERMQRMKAQRG